MLSSKKKILEKCSELGITCSKTLSKEKLLELIQQKEKTPYFDLTTTSTKIKYVYHVADIHIRYIERHEEYRLIFQKMYEEIKSFDSLEESVLVISGDIFHNRDRFVSETILLFNDFVKQMTSLVEVFAIVGNHDCFNHSDRLDSVSGISSIMSCPRFHLLDKSGIYKFSNIVFGVSSLLDGMGVPIAPEFSEGSTKIALYHGMVSGTILDNGIKTEDGITLESFKNYDLTLLGDIHRRQFLNKEKTIAYPGSLIQQTFKEELEHGVLRWNLETLKSTFVVLKNDYSFMDIHLSPELDLSNIKFTLYSRIRLFISQSDAEQKINETIEELDKYTKVISVKKHMSLVKNKDETSSGVQEDLDSHELEIIKNYTDEEHLDSVLELHSKIMSQIDYEEVFSKSLSWNIEKIEFKNIFSYGGDILNVIDLKNGITGILANNACGKTNILNTIMYGLFGSTRTQNHLNKNIISRYSKKEDLLVRLTIKMSTGEKYYIERTCKTKTRARIKSSEAGQLDVVESLKFFTDEKILNLSSKLDTEKLLRDTLSIIGKDEFVMTNMMSNISYGSTMSIISMSGAQFDEIFNNIFNLNKYSTLHKNAKAEAKRLADDIKTSSIKLDILKSNIKNYDSSKERENISTLEAVLLEKGKILDEFRDKIADIDSSLLSLKASGTTKTKESLQEDIIEYDAVLQEYSGDLQKLVKSEDKIFADYENTKILHKKDLTRGPDPCYDIKQTVEEIQEILISQESSKKKVEFDANITNDYIKAKKYLKNIELENNTLNLEDLSKTITDLEWCIEKDSYLLPKNLKEKITHDLTKTYIDPALLLKYKKIVEDKETRDENVAYNIKIDQNISKYKKLLSERRIQDAYSVKNKLKELAELMDYIDVFHDKNDALTELKAIKDNNLVNDLLKEKKTLMKNLEQTRGEIKSCEFDLHTAKKDLEMFEKTQLDIDKISPKLQLMTKDAEILKIYVEITHQKNLPKRIISNVIKNITDDANGLIYNTTGLLCEIQENDKWEVVVKKGDLILGPEHCSGYERFILNTSLKISFDKFKQLSSIKLFMIDETIDCVSESNLDQIDVLLECLYKHYGKVILISHNEDLKKKINNRIGIQIDGKISTII